MFPQRQYSSTDSRLPARARLVLGAVIAIAIAVRMIALGRLPGMNGDEAWYGVNVAEYLAGRPYFDRTLVGNRLNPFHSGPLLLASLVAPPSFALLRMPAALWGVLSVLLAYPLLRRPLGARCALMVTAVLAVSTAAVGQSRLGWDPSGTVFFSLLAVGLALQGRVLLAAAAGVAAVVVHPTNVFLAPMAASAWAPHGWSRLRQTSRRTQRLVAGAAAIGLVIGPVAAFVPARALAHRGLLPSIEMVLDRALSPAHWIGSAWGLVQLAAGVRTAESIAGPVSSPAGAVATVFIVLAITAAVALPVVRRDDRLPWAWWLAGGVVTSAAAFHIIAGERGLNPGLERYAMSFVAPLSILVALGLDTLWRRSLWLGAGAAAGTLASLAAVLTVCYFVPLSRGRAGHESYRTSTVEPKEAAYRFIAADSAGAGVVAVFAENWWIYWPVRYLAVTDAPRLFVEQLEPETLPLRPAGSPPVVYPHRPDKVYAVVFAGSAYTARLAALGSVAYTVTDPAGQPMLHVFSIPPDRADAVVSPAPWTAAPSARLLTSPSR
jgi:hypothetical protein